MVTADEVVQDLIDLCVELDEDVLDHPSVKKAVAFLRPRPEQAEVASLPKWVKTKPCYNCGQPIFFASRPHKKADGTYAWVPMCPHSVTYDSVTLDAHKVRFAWGVEGSPSLEDSAPGVQWVPHSVLCGRQDRPLDPQLAAIWDKTVGREAKEESEALDRFMHLLAETT